MLPFESPRVDSSGLTPLESNRTDRQPVAPLFAGTAYLARMLQASGPEYATFAREIRPEIPQLEKRLAEVESRLGTHDEIPGDLELCRNLAHKLSSLFCVGALMPPKSTRSEG